MAVSLATHRSEKSQWPPEKRMPFPQATLIVILRHERKRETESAHVREHTFALSSVCGLGTDTHGDENERKMPRSCNDWSYLAAPPTPPPPSLLPVGCACGGAYAPGVPRRGALRTGTVRLD
eukprot:578012-Pleurochrysis_carterae.AAC.4